MVGRGKVVELLMSQIVTFNGESYSRARIEIDHVNYGLNPLTKSLNTTERSHFTASDICLFLFELDGMELIPAKEDKNILYFALELQCPVKGSDFNKNYRLIFTLFSNEPGVIGTVTLYRIR